MLFPHLFVLLSAQGKEVAHILESNGIVHFPDPYTVGFGWDSDGSLLYPFKEKTAASAAAATGSGQQGPSQEEGALVGAAAKTWFAGTGDDAPRNADGSFRDGWHWNMPYKVKRDVPDLFRKEVERYTS
jgi:cell division protease FtsH